MTEIIRIDFKVSNAKIAAKIEEAGGICAFCKVHGISYPHVKALLRFEASPWRVISADNGMRSVNTLVLRKVAKRLCEICGVDPAEVFVRELYPEPGIVRTGFAGAFTVDSRVFLPLTEVRSLPSTSDPAEDVFALERKAALSKALTNLTPRVAKAISQRYGLDGNGELTLDEIGEGLHVSRERVRQIILNGLRKLRLHHIAAHLYPVL